MIDDFSIEIVSMNGFPMQTFKYRYKNIYELFCQSVSSYGEKLFLIEGATQLSFHETREKIDRMAYFLKRKCGVEKGDHVGIVMENSITFVITFFAIQKIGATAVVFNTRLAGMELERQINFSDLKLLLTTPLLSPKIREIPAKHLAIQPLVKEPNWENQFAEDFTEKLSAEIVDEDDVALMLFTSGTVGAPKGVMITHRNMITSAFKRGYLFSLYPELKKIANKKCVIAAPLFHVMALQEQLIGALFMGITCILSPHFQAQEILNLLISEHINIMTATPTMLWMLLHKTPFDEVHLDCVKMITFGGAPMPPDLLQELRQTFQGVRFMNGYGLTEASVVCMCMDEFCESHLTSVGHPTRCTEVRVVDPSGKEMPPNGVGELIVRGALVSKGYYKLPGETARVYRNGWLHTGDMAFLDCEGFVYLVGRTREMINRGGENVYPVEVENILHQHPKILDVAVFGIPDPVLGEAVGCAIILRPGSEGLSMAEIQEYCQGQLAGYKIPQKVFFVMELPRNPGGKVVKKELLQQVLNKRQ